MTEQEMIQAALELGFADTALIHTDQLVFLPQFRPLCQENLCGKYGVNYACPPDCGDPEDMKERVLRYPRALVLQTICATGIRVSELPAITAEAARRGVAVVRCKGKSRRVLIPTRLQKKLLRYMKQHRIAFGPVFVTRSGAPLDRSNIWREMKALCRAAGVSDKKVFPHNFRHLFARTFYRLNKDLAKLADLLGHSSINTTRIYIRTTSAEHRRCLERMRLVL